MSNSRIREIMDDQDVTVEEMADVLDINVRTMRGYYNGSKAPGRSLAINMAKILDVSVRDILGEGSDYDGRDD